MAHLGSMDEQQYVYTLGETEYRAVLRMDMDVGAAVITFLVDGEAVSLLEVIRTYTGAELAFLDLLPLSSLGFGWVLPAAVCGVIGALLPARAFSAP